jgi:hypothetical protein
MKIQYIGALINIIGSLGMLIGIIWYVLYRMQVSPKLIIPIILIFISLVCSAIVLTLTNRTVIMTLSYVALIYPVIMLFTVGTIITGSIFTQGLHSIEIPMLILLLFSIIASAGSVTTLIRV